MMLKSMITELLFINLIIILSTIIYNIMFFSENCKCKAGIQPICNVTDL